MYIGDRLTWAEAHDHPPVCQSVAFRFTGGRNEWRTLLVTPSVRIFGYEPDDFLSGRIAWKDFVHAEDLPGLRRVMEEFEYNGMDSFTLYFRVVTSRGDSLLVSSSVLMVRDKYGVPMYSDCIIASLDDSITGLPGRHCLEHQLTDAVNAATEKGTKGNVIYIDLDDFGDINSSYGIDVGDELLRQFATHLREDLPGCKAFRYGGDQFALIVPDGKDIYTIVQILVERSKLPWLIDGRKIYLTHSLGIAEYPDGADDCRTPLQNADLAKRLAKKKGKSTYYFYHDTKGDKTIVRTQTEQHLRNAVHHNFAGLTMHYQPLVNLDGRILGAEALMRWRNIEDVWVPPDQFIPLAEENGMIVELGNFAFREAVRVCKEVTAYQPDFFMSVNVSQRQMREPDLLPSIIETMASEICPPSNLCLELTEGMAMQDISHTQELCREFRRHKLRLSMDDFGTGHSALGHIRSLPLDVVKIDKVFTQNVETDQYSRTLMRMMTELTHSLGLKLCAEGVETSGQWDFCRACGIDYMQGYLFSKPLPKDDLFSLLAEEVVCA